MFDVRSTWMPVVDFTYRETPFLPDDPANMLKNGDFSPDTDVMLGATKEEGILFLFGNYDVEVPPHTTVDCVRLAWGKQLNLGPLSRNV